MAKTRRGFTLAERFALLTKYDSLSHLSQRAAAAEMGISQPLLCKLLHNRQSIEADLAANKNVNRKRKRDGKAADLEEALYMWYIRAIEKQEKITNQVLFNKARSLSVSLGLDNFSPTDGWLSRWKERNNVGRKNWQTEVSITRSSSYKAPENQETPKLEQCPCSSSNTTTTYVVRLLPGMPLKQSLLDFCKTKGLSSASVSTCVGSLTKVTIRTAKGVETKQFSGHYEIVSLVGTISGGEGHLHICISDEHGQVFGGHLMGEDSIFTTAEVVICDMGPNVTFKRQNCSLSGWPELTF